MKGHKCSSQMENLIVKLILQCFYFVKLMIHNMSNSSDILHEGDITVASCITKRPVGNKLMIKVGSAYISQSSVLHPVFDHL